MFPVMLGAGQRLFGETGNKKPMRLGGWGRGGAGGPPAARAWPWPRLQLPAQAPVHVGVQLGHDGDPAGDRGGLAARRGRRDRVGERVLGGGREEGGWGGGGGVELGVRPPDDRRRQDRDRASMVTWAGLAFDADGGPRPVGLAPLDAPPALDAPGGARRLPGGGVRGPAWTNRRLQSGLAPLDAPPALDPPGGARRFPAGGVRGLALHELAARVPLDDHVVGFLAEPGRRPQRRDLADDVGELGRAARVPAFPVVDDGGDQAVPPCRPCQRRLPRPARDLRADDPDRRPRPLDRRVGDELADRPGRDACRCR